MLEKNPQIIPLLPIDRFKKRTTNILFNNGKPLIYCGPALGNLQGKGFKVVNCDEPWLYESGTLANAKARLGDYEKIQASKFIGTSQAGDDGSDWDIQFRTGELNEWFVKCQGCGQYFITKWTLFLPSGERAGVVFDCEKDKAGNYNIQKAMKTCRYVCQFCAHSHPDTHETRAIWNETGEYRLIGDPNETMKSFHWSAIIDTPLKTLVKDFLVAKSAANSGNYEPLVAFWQKRMAETKSIRTVHESQRVFAKPENSEAKGDLVPNLRLCTVDVQEDHFWVAIRDWWYGGKSIGVSYKQVWSWTEVTETWKAYGVQPNAVWIDAGHRPKGLNGVYAYCIMNGCLCCKGDKERSYEWKTTSMGKEVKFYKGYSAPKNVSPEVILPDAIGKFATLVVFSSNSTADKLQELIQSKLWTEIPNNYGDLWETYQKQMSAEARRYEINKYGNEESVWEDMSQGQNHAWDCSKIQTLAATINKLITSNE